MNMTKNEQVKNLVKFLETSAKEHTAEANEQTNNYLRGFARGYADAYELCAKWINEILEL